MEKLYLKRNEA